MDVRVVTVSQVVEYLRILTESDSFLGRLWVEGEVSEVFVSRSAHLYFSLTDGNAKIKGVAYRNVAMRVQHVLTAGASVTVSGRATVYAPRAEFQIVAEFADSSGVGILALEYQRLRAKLEADGLFDPARKRPLPEFPRVIGVVTSPGGAVIHDIQTVLRRRFPLVELIVSPAQVQGAGAPDSIRRAFDHLLEDGRAEVIIIARGGGSAEDLSAFNDENLARMAFASPVPVVSAIGHETDFSLLDDVADLRAPTPTAAAELCTPDIAEFSLQIVEFEDRMGRAIDLHLRRAQSALNEEVQRLDRSTPDVAIARCRTNIVELERRLNVVITGRTMRARSALDLEQTRLHHLGLRRFDNLRTDLAARRLVLGSLVLGRVAEANLACQNSHVRLDNAWSTVVASRRQSLLFATSRLRDLSPRSVLHRGYSVLLDGQGELVASIAQTRSGAAIQAIVEDGTIQGTVTSTVPIRR